MPRATRLMTSPPKGGDAQPRGDFCSPYRFWGRRETAFAHIFVLPTAQEKPVSLPTDRARTEHYSKAETTSKVTVDKTFWIGVAVPR